MTGRPRRGLGVRTLAGWLFADLLLVLTLVTLGGQADPLAAKAHPGATPHHSGGATPSPSPTGPRSLEKKSVRINVHGSDTGSLARQIRAATAPYARRQAALVLTFGGGQAGDRYAGVVNSALIKARPTVFPAQTTTRDYLDLGAPVQTAHLEVFFYTYPR